MLFDRPLAPFTNNIIYIDRPKNHKAGLVVDCIIFCFQKITSFHRPHNNFKTLMLPSKLQRGKCQESFLNTRSIVVFRRNFRSNKNFWNMRRQNMRQRLLARSLLKTKWRRFIGVRWDHSYIGFLRKIVDK